MVEGLAFHESCEDSCDSLAGESVAIGVAGLSHLLVALRVFQQVAYGCYDGFAACSDELGGAGVDAFGSFGDFAHDENGFAECGCFFLYATGVCQDQVGAFHEPDHGGVVDGWEEMDVVEVVQHCVDGLLYVGVFVDGVKEVDVRVELCQIPDCQADLTETFTEAFASVSGDEDEGLVIEEGKLLLEFFVPVCGSDQLSGTQECINTGVAYYVDVSSDVFGVEVAQCGVGGWEVDRGKGCGESSVDFFGEGCVSVVGTQSGFYVCDRDLAVEAGECAGEGGGGVALDDSEVGLVGVEDFFQS